jgi:hypothetical protein
MRSVDRLLCHLLGLSAQPGWEENYIIFGHLIFVKYALGEFWNATCTNKYIEADSEWTIVFLATLIPLLLVGLCAKEEWSRIGMKRAARFWQRKRWRRRRLYPCRADCMAAARAVEDLRSRQQERDKHERELTGLFDFQFGLSFLRRLILYRSYDQCQRNKFDRRCMSAQFKL